MFSDGMVVKRPVTALVLYLLLREFVQKVKRSIQVHEIQSQWKLLATAGSCDIEFVSKRPKVGNTLSVFRKSRSLGKTVFCRLSLDLGQGLTCLSSY